MATRSRKKRHIPYPAGSSDYMREYSRITRAEAKAKKNKPKKQISKPTRKGTKGGGPAPKDAAFTDNFNPQKLIQPTDADLRKAKDILGLDTDVSEDDALGLSNEESAYAMLEDMRAVYQKVGGRKKLLKMIKGDDKKFATMVKDLMKVETALLTAEIRKAGAEKAKEGAGQNNFFVVLKGLDTDEATLGRLSEDGAIDLEQVNAAFNPESHLVPMGNQEEEQKDRDAPPDGLFGGGNDGP